MNSLISGIEDAGMESISLVLAGVSAEAEGEKTGDKAPIFTSGDKLWTKMTTEFPQMIKLQARDSGSRE
ncbi:hypothetical protein J6590_067860 [Homalodisca vitripennis]|nr:hypothetical protein J6590_067860 [Homalodisca vitripennis]